MPNFPETMRSLEERPIESKENRKVELPQDLGHAATLVGAKVTSVDELISARAMAAREEQAKESERMQVVADQKAARMLVQAYGGKEAYQEAVREYAAAMEKKILEAEESLVKQREEDLKKLGLAVTIHQLNRDIKIFERQRAAERARYEGD